LPLPREVREGYLKPYGTWEDRIAIHRFVKDIPLSEKDCSFKTLREVEGKLSLLADKPILLIWGERDFVFDGHFLDEWLRRFPKALVHRFKEGGHYILEDKKDEAITLIRSFLQDSAR
jgi:haloalkane dehalogenase